MFTIDLRMLLQVEFCCGIYILNTSFLMQQSNPTCAPMLDFGCGILPHENPESNLLTTESLLDEVS